MRNKCEAESLNVLELELVKGLQHMIGETEPVSILKHAFSLVKNYLTFGICGPDPTAPGSGDSCLS